jgi:hypothetical protein
VNKNMAKVKMMILRGRKFTDNEINLIKQTIIENKQLNRYRLSLLISEQLNWRQANGRLKDRACRDVLLRLEKQGVIQLPPAERNFQTQKIKTQQFNFIEPQHQLIGQIHNFSTPFFKLVTNKKDRQFWNYLIESYHYKGCRTVVGRHLKYLLYIDSHLIGCLCFADAVLHLKLRDEWIGWDINIRESNLHLIINNVRFLLLPWVRIKNLASKILSLSAAIVPENWHTYYHYRPVLFETFIEKDRFVGTSYQAANWIYLGRTNGKGRSGMNYYYHGIPKNVYVYPLVKHAKKNLCKK